MQSIEIRMLSEIITLTTSELSCSRRSLVGSTFASVQMPDQTSAAKRNLTNISSVTALKQISVKNSVSKEKLP